MMVMTLMIAMMIIMISPAFSDQPKVKECAPDDGGNDDDDYDGDNNDHDNDDSNDNNYDITCDLWSAKSERLCSRIQMMVMMLTMVMILKMTQ